METSGRCSRPQRRISLLRSGERTPMPRSKIRNHRTKIATSRRQWKNSKKLNNNWNHSRTCWTVQTWMRLCRISCRRHSNKPSRWGSSSTSILPRRANRARPLNKELLQISSNKKAFWRNWLIMQKSRRSCSSKLTLRLHLQNGRTNTRPSDQWPMTFRARTVLQACLAPWLNSSKPTSAQSTKPCKNSITRHQTARTQPRSNKLPPTLPALPRAVKSRSNQLNPLPIRHPMKRRQIMERNQKAPIMWRKLSTQSRSFSSSPLAKPSHRSHQHSRPSQFNQARSLHSISILSHLSRVRSQPSHKISTLKSYKSHFFWPSRQNCENKKRRWERRIHSCLDCTEKVIKAIARKKDSRKHLKHHHCLAQTLIANQQRPLDRALPTSLRRFRRIPSYQRTCHQSRIQFLKTKNQPASWQTPSQRHRTAHSPTKSTRTRSSSWSTHSQVAWAVNTRTWQISSTTGKRIIRLCTGMRLRDFGKW